MSRSDSPDTLDHRVRLAAIRFLEQETVRHGDVLPHSVLRRGFTIDDTRVPLWSPQGIFKPAVLPEMPLTIRTAAPEEGAPPPYDDTVGPKGLLRYRYRGTDPDHRDNVGLRLAMQRHVPLIYLFGIVPGQYLPIWPVYVVEDDPDRLTFGVAVESERLAEPLPAEIDQQVRRAYVTRITVHRLHQHSFRERVLRAYRTRCAMCRLRHAELLEAAHIIPDTDGGEPIVPNGLALCNLHHKAFDRHILGVRPDLTVEVRADILEEVDGPMLEHGLQEMNGVRLDVPGSQRFRPREAFLEARYALFREAEP